MSREKRIQYEGAWYHVMNRGAGKKYILKDSHNKETFLELLGEIHKKYEIEVHAYCIMDNHYHLLIRTPNGNLASGMKHLQAMFTRIFNKKVNSDGPIFKGRYKSILIESTSSIINVCRYIHLNPVEAKFKSGLNYRWSSYNKYTSVCKGKPDWLYLNFILDNIKNIEDFRKYHSKDNSNGLKLFYVENNDKTCCLLNNDINTEYLNKAKFNIDRISMQEIEKNIQHVFNITNTKDNTNFLARNLLIIIAIKVFNFSNVEVKNYLKLKYVSTIAKVLAQYEHLFECMQINNADKIYNIIKLILSKSSNL